MKLVGRYLAGALIGGLLLFACWHADHETDAWDGAVKAWHQHTIIDFTQDRAREHDAQVARDSAAALGNTLQSYQAAIAEIHDNLLGGDSSVLGKFRTACTNIVTRCAAQVALWAKADTIDAARADTMGRALQHSDSLLRVGLKVASCHVLGLLPCPSRNLMFVLGAVGGAWLARH